MPACIVYGTSSGYTEDIAFRLGKLGGVERANIRSISEIGVDWFQAYDLIILGTSTWGVGEIQEDWKDFIEQHPLIKGNGKRAALFGLGNQGSYPDTFVDGLATLYHWAYSCGFLLHGRWPVEGYVFAGSKASENGYFPGLVLDEITQPELTETRLKQWIELIHLQLEKLK